MMAELQWAVQVKCINALLAEIKVGEKGELIIVNVPDRNFGPSELDKLVEGLEVASVIAAQNRKKSQGVSRRHDVKSKGKLGRNVAVKDKRSLYKLEFLKTGEIIRVNVPDMLFTPSETAQFVTKLRQVSDRMARLRAQAE